MPADNFSIYPPELNSPGRQGYVVAPSDTVDLTDVPRFFWVNSGDTVRGLDLEGNELTFTVVAGSPLPFRLSRVFATGTNATLIGCF